MAKDPTDSVLRAFAGLEALDSQGGDSILALFKRICKSFDGQSLPIAGRTVEDNTAFPRCRILAYVALLLKKP